MISKWLRNLARRSKLGALPDETVESQKLGALPDETIDEEKRKTLKILGAGGAATIMADPLIGALSKIKSTAAPKNVDGIIAEFAKTQSRLFDQVPHYSNPYLDISKERMAELLKNPSRENLLTMLREMGSDQREMYGKIQNKVARSLQLRAMKDGAEPIIPHMEHMGKKLPHSELGYGGAKIEEPFDATDVKNSVYDTSTEVNKKEIKLVEDYYDALKKQGYSAQEIFDNPYLLKKGKADPSLLIKGNLPINPDKVTK